MSMSIFWEFPRHCKVHSQCLCTLEASSFHITLVFAGYWPTIDYHIISYVTKHIRWPAKKNKKTKKFSEVTLVTRIQPWQQEEKHIMY